MRRFRALIALVALLLPVTARAADECEPDGARGPAVLAAREAIRASCECERAASHRAYVQCAKSTIRQLAHDGALPAKCRARLRQYAKRSTCGRRDLNVCCEASDAFHVFPKIRKKGHCSLERGSFCVASFPHVDEACVQTGTLCRGSSCGDGILDRPNGEECEPPGVGLCDQWCRVIVCGNGVLDPGEQCEPPRTPTCDFRCRAKDCGNGVVEPDTEECEPPNTPTCDDQCYRTHDCGNGVVDFSWGEQCEPPGSASCDAQCQFIHTCGNGVIEPGEECDGQAGCDGCRLARSACCEFGNYCIGGSASSGFDAYWYVFKPCYILGGNGSYGVCEGPAECPPGFPPGVGCKHAACSDRPIDPMPLCCDEIDGTCRDTIATTASAVGSFGCSGFPPPSEGDVPHLMIGSCGANGRCVATSGGGTTP
jgi:hypothetical protein